MAKTKAEKNRDYWRKKNANKIKKIPKSSTERVREFRKRRKKLLSRVHNENDSSNVNDNVPGVPNIMAGSDTSYEYKVDAPGSSNMKKLGTETVIRKCLTTFYTRQDFKSNETESTDDESRRGSMLQVMIDDVVIQHDSNPKEVDDENSTIYHEQKQKQIIGDRFNEAPKLSAVRDQESRKQISLLKQQSKQKLESYVIVEIATKDTRSAGPSKDNQVPGTTEIRTIEQRAKSAEATRRWREKKRDISNSPREQAKTAAQRMQEYRKRKKLAKLHQSEQDLEANEMIVSTTSHQVNQSACLSAIRGTSQCYSCTPYGNRLWFTNDLAKSSDDCGDLLKKITLHTDCEIPIVIKTEKEPENNEGSNPEETESAEPNLQPSLVTVKREIDDSCSDSEDPLVVVRDKTRKYNYISTTNISTETVKAVETPLLIHQIKQDLDANEIIVSTSPRVNQSAGPSTINSTSQCYSRTPYCNRLRLPNDLVKASDDCKDLLKKLTFHKVCDIPFEEVVIKKENESENNEESNLGEEESAEPNLQLSLFTVKREKDGSYGDSEDPPVVEGDISHLEKRQFY